MKDIRQDGADRWALLCGRWFLRRASHLGIQPRVWGCPVVQNLGVLAIGDYFRLISTTAKTEMAIGRGAQLEIGNQVFINYGCSISASELVRISDYCAIGDYCTIMDNNFHRTEPARRSERPPSKPVILEENVWLGVRVIVLPGVTIGQNSVVGAGSVVTSDIPPAHLLQGSRLV